MKAKFIAVTCLVISFYGNAQTYSAPSSAGDGGGNNVYVGELAGSDPLNSGNYNVFLGYKSGLENTTGFRNVFVGYLSGNENTTGEENVFVGYQAGRSNSSTGNIFIGSSAGRDNISNSNTFIGLNSGQTNSTGNQNSFYGYLSGLNSTGNYNVFVGAQTGKNSTGNSNVFIGNSAGRDITTGNNLLFIANSPTSNPLIYGEFTNASATPILKLNAQKVGIGFESGSTGFGNFPTLSGVTNANIYKLFVRGGILAEEVRIRLQSSWPDYVFSKEYDLLSLKKIEQFILKNGHLPNMPSATQVKSEGIEMGNIIKLQQEKIEELTLHAIKQEKRNDLLENEVDELKKQIKLLLDKK